MSEDEWRELSGEEFFKAAAEAGVEFDFFHQIYVGPQLSEGPGVEFNNGESALVILTDADGLTFWGKGIE